jgi:hypothetical protein
MRVGKYKYSECLKINRVTLRLKICESVVSSNGRMKEVMLLHIPY